MPGGTTTTVAAMMPMPDYKVQVGKAPKKSADELTRDEAMSLFGIDAVKMNFVPCMLMSLAMDYASTLVNYCRDNRIKQTRKHIKLIEQCIHSYIERMYAVVGTERYRTYLDFTQQYFDRMATNRQRMWFSFLNVAHKQIAEEWLRPIAVYIAIIRRLMAEAEHYERRNDRRYTAALGFLHVHRREDMIILMEGALKAMESALGLTLLPDVLDDLSMAHFRTAASLMVDDVMSEENDNTNLL